MKKYCIETFEKHKSDVVGEAALGDPLIEQKHTNKPLSNMPTSNIQHPTSNDAITLIALIITIIVLLILAGVTLSIVMGDSGLFNKANLSKEQTQKSTAEETIKLAVLENKTKEAAGKTALTDTELKEEIAGKLKDLGFTVADNNNDVTYYEDKTIKIEDYLEKKGEITAKMVAENPEIYYGKSVDFISKNEQNNWKIFYSDWKEKSEQQKTDNPTDTHIFLITDDCINASEQNKVDSATDMVTKEYGVYWKSPVFQNVESQVLDRFKANGYVLNDGKVNSKCVSTLLNSNNWSGYKDNDNKAEYVIGSPTIEMWMKSWNERYTDSNEQLYCDKTNSNGYYVGISKDANTSNIDKDEMKNKGGYGDELYYPHTDYYNNIRGYFFSSPSAYKEYYILCVYYSGQILYEYFSTAGECGVRPVVCLKSNVGVNMKE